MHEDFSKRVKPQFKKVKKKKKKKEKDYMGKNMHPKLGKNQNEIKLS